MISFAGTGIAMGNACAELKDRAAYITAGVEHGGVAQALRRYL
jgi:hydroxymethylpyrimidine pyrophosphatase-like HAD family hydrolase